MKNFFTNRLRFVCVVWPDMFFYTADMTPLQSKLHGRELKLTKKVKIYAKSHYCDHSWTEKVQSEAGNFVAKWSKTQV